MTEQNESLSERELEILRLVATGAANKEIAYRLEISPNTVKVHLRNIFSKIGVASRTEATLYAIKIGLVQPVKGDAASANQVDAVEHASDLAGQVLPSGLVQPETAPQETRIWRSPALIIGLVMALLVILVGSVYGGMRLFAPPITPTVASEAANAAEPSPRWSIKASLPAARKGMGYAEYENQFYLVGGETAAGADGALLRYDLASDTWQTLTSKPTAVTDVQAVLLGEKIYVPGGRLQNGSATDQLEVYDPRSDSWETKASLPVGLWGYALAAYEGQLYLFGGKNEDAYFSSVYAYLPQEDRWEERTAMSAPRAYASAVVVGNKVHLLGGYDGSKALALNEAYFPTRDGSDEPAWESYNPLPAPRYAMSSVQMAGLVFVLGGLDEEGTPGDLRAVQYMAQSDSWFEFNSPPKAAGAQPALLVAGNFLYLVGGDTAAGLTADQQSYQAIFTISVPLVP